MKTTKRTLLLCFVFCSLIACDKQDDHGASETSAKAEPRYIGTQTCVACHEQEYKTWQNSHHDLAMQEATAETVVGKFDGRTFKYNDVESTFYTKDNQFYARTDGPDGKLTDYPIAYTFGVYPLQQYLIKFPKGRYQALNVVWDSRPKEQGGQRWFHLYPEAEQIDYKDELHWTGIYQNWNFMCADCHSTDLRKNYDFNSDSYQTTWFEINVACEACHGPGSNHVAWAEQPEADRAADDIGLTVLMRERHGVSWAIDASSGNAKRSQPRQTTIEIENCGRCHARRSVIHGEVQPGDPLLDNYRPSLLVAGTYHVDGQIDDEDYVYGSFVQSKMYRAGITCSDCHDPHSLQLRMPGNLVCLQCHLPDKFNNEQHHFHKSDYKPRSYALGNGTQCVDCHMPSKVYMGNDDRRDHNYHIPRPDLSVKYGTPNACNQCHDDKNAEWASSVVTKWYGPQEKPHFASALHAGRTAAPNAHELLKRIINDPDQAGIVRATALNEISRFVTMDSLPSIHSALRSDDPLIRYAAVGALDMVPVQQRTVMLFPLLEDPVRLVRIDAARALAGLPPEQLEIGQRQLLEKVLDEYMEEQRYNADRPGALTNLASIYVVQQKWSEAEKAYKDAIKRGPHFTPAYVNLADLYRQQGKDDKGEQLLKSALAKVRVDAPIQHGLGLLYARQKRYPEALSALKTAADHAPELPRYIYVYAVALYSTGKHKQALQVLESAHQSHPTDMDILYSLVTFYRENGQMEKSTRHLKRLAELYPNHPVVQQLRGH